MKKFFSWITLLHRPLLHEWPFITFFVILMGWKSFGELFSHLVTDNHESTLLNLSGRLAFVFLMGYFLALLIHLTGKRWVKVSVYVLVVSLFAVHLYINRQFGLNINPTLLVLLGETTGREASEFINLHLLSRGSLTTYLIIISVVVAIIFTEQFYQRRLRQSIVSRWGKSLWLSLPTLCLLILGIIASRYFFWLTNCPSLDHLVIQDSENVFSPNDPISSLIKSTYGIHLASKEVDEAIETTRQMDKPTGITEPDSLNLVLVIGESFNKWHSNLYGYTHITNPLLTQEADSGHLFVFTDMVSPFCLTTPALKNMLCCNSFSDGENWSKSPFLPAIFRQAGYDVYLWDNQCDNSANGHFTFALNYFLFHPTIRSLSYNATNERSFRFDYGLIHAFQRDVRMKGKYNLLIFHLMGQHFAPQSRYPQVEQFCRFTADSIHRNESYLTKEKKQHIAEYDNATLYNDYVLSRIIDMQRDKNAVIVYLSDHGEETYDYKDAMGRQYETMDKGWLQHIHDVPFMIWCSDLYMKRHPETAEAIRQSTHRKAMTDNLCHLLFHLGGVRTSYYIADRDVISDQFRFRRRIVEGKGKAIRTDYDQLRWP